MKESSEDSRKQEMLILFCSEGNRDSLESLSASTSSRLVCSEIFSAIFRKKYFEKLKGSLGIGLCFSCYSSCLACTGPGLIPRTAHLMFNDSIL